MHKVVYKTKLAALLLTGGMLSLVAGAATADTLDGQVLGGGLPVADSTVTLWAAGSGPPLQMAQARTDADGRFAFNSTGAPGADASLYLAAKGGHATDKTSGDNPALCAIEVLGTKPPTDVTINEMTTVASVWTHAQFIDGTKIQGHALGLRIAAGNVPNFVDSRLEGRARPFKARSMAARRPPWPILPRWPTYLQAAPRT